MSQSVYDFSATTSSGEEVSLEQYKGKVLLIVNTASQCGFTPQYEGLEALYEKYKGQLEVLAFPCNQFGNQEPGSDEDIRAFCDARFHVTFPLFSKIEVNGSDAHPLFDYLKAEQPGLMGTKAIKWNFTKFLIDREGKPVQRYAPKTKPEAIESEIQELLQGS